MQSHFIPSLLKMKDSGLLMRYKQFQVEIATKWRGPSSFVSFWLKLWKWGFKHVGGCVSLSLVCDGMRRSTWDELDACEMHMHVVFVAVAASVVTPLPINEDLIRVGSMQRK
jgi:hypothetical protein